MMLTTSPLNSVDLFCALMMNEIIPYYQPMINSENQKLYGLEILMRWSLYEVNASPEVLIRAFEENGLLPEMTQHLLRQVAADINELDSMLPIGLHFSFNVSPSQVTKPGFVFDTLSFLAAIPLEKYQLVVEVTEEPLLPSTPEVSDTLFRLKLAGVKVYLDDFSSACSNLNYLDQSSVDGVKVNQFFLNKLSFNKEATSIEEIIAVIVKARHLGVIAGGVETLQQSKQLSDMGITIQQGGVFSEALSKAQLIKYLSTRLPSNVSC